jgi:hypothetical protein
MELAIHLRNIKQVDGLGRLQGHLSSIYENAFSNASEPGEGFTRSFDRIYIGDEFCPHRLPRLAELEALFNFARDSRKQITLLTPLLTDYGVEGLSSLLDRLHERFLEAEVVANDWGVILFLKEEYPEFRLAAGRLLDKGFKDPRLSNPRALASQSQEMEAVLKKSSFDSPALQRKLVELDVERIERDMFPYSGSPPASAARLKTSIYFPYGYITTGRVCWMSTFGESSESKFVPPSDCSRPCNGISVKLEHSDAALPVFQSGGTVYHLQPPEALESIFETAKRENVRLVYQGFAL